MKTDKERIGEMLIKSCEFYTEGICTVKAPIYKVTDRVYPSKDKCPRMNQESCYGGKKDEVSIQKKREKSKT